MKEKRWRAFGHILRLDNEVPCQQAMVYYFDPPHDAKKYSGRKRMTLPVVLDEDLKETAKSKDKPVRKFECLEDLQSLRSLAVDRQTWRKLVNVVCGKAEDD